MLSAKFRTSFFSPKNQDGAQKGTILIFFGYKPKVSSKLMRYQRLLVSLEQILVNLGDLLVKMEQILVN
jgi:hypothetical protein